MDYLYTVLYVAATCLLASCQSTLQDIRPEFTKEPTSEIVKKGSRVKLKCAFWPKEGDVRWWFDGTPLSVLRLEQLELSINNGHLIIESFKAEERISHVGYYQCQVTTEVGTILSKLAYLQLPDIREFKQRLTEEVRAPQGGEVVIPCEAPDSRPAAVVTYLKNGLPLSSHSDHHLVLPSGHLHIIDVTDEDAGNYSCRAENPVSRLMVSSPSAIPLKVETDIFQSNVQPIIVYTSGDLVQRGETAMLECGCIGKPLPQVRWSKVDGVLPDVTSQHGSTLIIDDVAVKDAGTYRCTAENGHGEGSSSEEVQLEVSKTPSIKKPPKDADVIPGDTATFKCIVGRASDEDVRWYFNGRALTQVVDKYSIDGGELVVRSVTMADLGMYQCFVQTIEGSVQAAARMKLSDGFPRIIGEPQATTAIEGELVTMVCKIHGSPLPTVGWTNNLGRRVISSDRMKVTEEFKEDVFIARLMIINVGQEDVGNYTCAARNKLGIARASASLYVINLSDLSTTTQSTRAILNPPNNRIASDAAAIPTSTRIKGGLDELKPEAPAAPTKPSLTMVSETSVLITWNHTHSPRAPLVGFRVQYRNIKRTDIPWDTVSVLIPSREMSYTVSDLNDKDAIYRFRVTAVGMDGMESISPMSNRFLLSFNPNSFTPPTPIPFTPSAPRLTSCTALGMDKIKVDWEYEPLLHEGLVEGFYIFLRLTDSDDDRDYVRTPILGPDNRKYVITKLEPEVSYDIKMSTFTKHRESDFSNVVIQNTLAPVTEPPAIIIPKPVTEDPFAVAPTASPVGGAKENVLYIILGVVLGGMMLLMTMFIVMCFWRNKHMRGEVTMMRYVPPDLQHTMYNNGQYPYDKTHNGSLPHFNEPNGVAGLTSRKAHSASQLTWTETRPLYTMPQDTLSNGGPVLPYKTVPSAVMHLYSPLTTCSEAEVAEVPIINEQQQQPPPPCSPMVVDGSIPSLCSMSHNSLGPRPVCRIKRCRIPDENEMTIPPLLVPRHGRSSCSGDDSECGSLSLKLTIEGNIKPSSGLSIPSTTHDDDQTSNCSRPRSSSNQSNASSHQSNHHSDSSNGSHQSFPVSVHSNSSVVTDV